MPSSSYQVPAQLWKSIWRLKLTPKIRTFLWSLCHNALATKTNLVRRHISTDMVCNICNNNCPKSLEHLFLCCPWTTTIWSHPTIGLHLTPHDVPRIEQWLADRANQKQSLPEFKTIAEILWQIWKARNTFVFHSHRPDPLHLLNVISAKVQTARILHRRSIAIGLPSTLPSQVWRPPDPGVPRFCCIFASAG